MNKSKGITIILASSALLLYSCDKVSDSGEAIVENGKGEKKTINFQCIGCVENIKTSILFDEVIEEAGLLTKNSLKYPLSFDPISIELTVIREDSLYYFEDNKEIKNVIRVFAQYAYIAKNSYGNELEGETINSFYVKDEKVADLENEIRLEELFFEDGYINRTLAGYGEDSDFIEFMPTKDKSIIVKSSLGCVDEGSIFKIILENDDEIELISWNDFNCDGTAYFNWFNQSQIEKLRIGRIKYLFTYSRGESAMVEITKNKNDYFQQLIELYE
jgi:hypothetical protein